MEVRFDSHAKQNLYRFMPESVAEEPGIAGTALAISGQAVAADAGIAGIT